MGILDRFAAALGYRKADTIQADWLRMTAESEQYNIPDGTLGKGQAELYQKLSWVQIAISTVAKGVATTKFGVSQLKGEKTTEIENHPFEMLLRRPNPLMSRFELLEATVSYKRLAGNAYWWLNRSSETATPDEIWIIPPHRIKPVPDGKMYLKGYVYESDNGDEIPLERYEVMHFKDFHPTNSFVGLSPLEALSTITTGDLAMQRWNTNLFDKDNAKMPGALAFADFIEDAEWAKMKADINVKHGGTKRSLMMLRNVGKGGVQWVNMAMSQRDMEFLAGRTSNKEEIFSIYAPGLASMLAVNATEANSKAGKATFMELAVFPQLNAIAEKITNDLLPAYGENLVGEFEDVRIADRGMAIAEQSAAEHVQTVDEIRQTFYNLGPLADDRGIRLINEAPPQAEGSNMGGEEKLAIHDYHIKGGIITKDEARQYYGLPPLNAESPTELEAKFQAVAAGIRVGVAAEDLFKLVGLDTGLLPAVATTVTVVPPKQLTAAPEQKPDEQRSIEPPHETPVIEDEDDAMRQAEIKAFKKWLKKRPDADVGDFKTEHLTADEVNEIAMKVRQGVAPVDNFFREWQSYP